MAELRLCPNYELSDKKYQFDPFFFFFLGWGGEVSSKDMWNVRISGYWLYSRSNKLNSQYPNPEEEEITKR